MPPPADRTPDPADPGPHPGFTIKRLSDGSAGPEVSYDRLPVENVAREGRLARLDQRGEVVLGPETSDARYEIHDRLGAGGMGVVYSARQICLDREVALKLHRRGGGDPGDSTVRESTRFAIEAHVTASLEHPNVIPVYTLARDADRRLYFTMRRVEGVPWSDLLHPAKVEDPERRARVEGRAAEMSWREHLKVLLRVADAAAYAHSKGILHRDLKPDNVMLGEFGEVYVMDWGLALPFDERNPYHGSEEPDPELTGTPHYMAPEMARGEVATLGPAADIFLLGAILTEVMTGRPPERGSTIVEIIGQAARGDYVCPVPPPDAPRIHPTMSRILSRALAAKPTDRYPDVRSFQADLREYIDHADSIEVSSRARRQIETLEAEIRPGQEDRRAAAMVYGRISEAVGRFRQALEIWGENGDARDGLLRSVSLQVRPAASVGDLAMARAQLTLLSEVPGPGAPEDIEAVVNERRRELSRVIEARESRLFRTARQARRLRVAATMLALLLLAATATVLLLLRRERDLAVAAERDLFVAAVTARARNGEQLMLAAERVVGQYCQEAERLLTAGADRLPPRALTPAGRAGYYLDEDFYDPATRPPDMQFRARYDGEVSFDAAAVVLAPGVRHGRNWSVVEEDAERLARLDTRFAQVHAVRDDLLWSFCGTKSGVLISFPGAARFRDKPDYDPRERIWYTQGIDSSDGTPVWGVPYADAASERIVLSCVCPFSFGGEPYGVVGVDVSVTSIREMLLDFTRGFGGRTRCLVLRPFRSWNVTDGKEEIGHRVIVDTATSTEYRDWREHLEFPRPEEVDPCVALYYQDLLAGKAVPGRCARMEGLLLAHAPIGDRGWILLSLTEEH